MCTRLIISFLSKAEVKPSQCLSIPPYNAWVAVKRIMDPSALQCSLHLFSRVGYSYIPLNSCPIMVFPHCTVLVKHVHMSLHYFSKLKLMYGWAIQAYRAHLNPVLGIRHSPRRYMLLYS